MQMLESNDELLSNFVVEEVKDTENGGILEYSDNDNVVEISGEENNFQTSIEIWGENTTNETQELNTIPANTTLESNTVDNENTIANEVANEITNETTNQVTNEVTNEILENVIELNTVTPEEISPEEVIPEQSEPVQEENTEPERIEEEDNFRTQGYIEINENAGDNLEDNTFIIGENYEETLKNITEWTKKIDWSTYLLTGAKANCTKEELIEEIEKILNAIVKENSSCKVKVYVKDGKTIKMNCEFPDTFENIDLEIISKNEKEKYLNMTFLRGKDDSSNGYKISIYKKDSDAVKRMKISINGISKNKIYQKTSLDMQTKGTLNAKQYDTDINLSYSNSDGEFKMQLGNLLNFDITPEIQELNNENCLFLDTLSNEELLLTIDAIKVKTTEVLKEKNKNLNIIDVNNSNLVVQQTDQNQISEEEVAAKEGAKQALIKKLSDEMRAYLNEGKQLKIEDLQNLEIPGYEVNISISSNLAIITVNGYKFKLDSDFNLSDS